MRSCLVAALSCYLLSSAIAGAAGEGRRQTDSPPVDRAWEFIETVMVVGVAEFLRRHRPPSVSPELRARVVASLPAEGEMAPTPAELTKLSALDPVLDLYGRLGLVDIKVVDVNYAFAGVHGRTILLITREALTQVNAGELQAIAAHELAHEYFRDEYDAALKAGAYERLQELELRCDGIAVMTLRLLGIDAAHLGRAAAKLARYNERIGVTSNGLRQVSLEARLAFIRKVDARVTSDGQ
jgi:hypothetical protein